MGLSNDLISQFVKTTKATAKRNDESTVYGTTKEYDGAIYVQLDGSELLTPVSTTAATGAGERVAVRIKDHTAMITGNVSFPAAKNSVVESIGGELTKYATIEGLTAMDADIYNLKAIFLTAEDAAFKYVSTDQLEADYITSAEIDALYVSTNKLEADYTKTTDLEAKYATITSLDAAKASIDDLYAVKIDAETVRTDYADINFANISEAAIESFYSKSGIIENLVVSEGHVTRHLVGVKISGDLIEANTLKADKIVVLGEDGLYYKLNVASGGFAEGEVVPTDGLDGRVLIAKSVTANEIYVDDLVAFGATIGGFTITDSAIYSGAKKAYDNETDGIYLDKLGRFSVGDGNNYIKYYLDDEGDGHLEIAAEDIIFGVDSKASLANMSAVAEKVKIAEYEDADGNIQPSIELSEGDTAFKQVITNTASMFIDGEEVKTEINTGGIETENITVRKELHHGNFAWIYDETTGNYDLEYKG